MSANRETEPHQSGANGSGPSGRDRPVDSLASERQGGADLKGKVVLIVDGTTDDGQALALAFARRGMHVALLYFNQEHHSAAAVKKKVEAQERRCLLISWADLSERAGGEQSARQVMHQITETFGRLDVFVNLSTDSRPLNGDGRAESQRPNLRSRLFPHLHITQAALRQIVKSDC